MLTILSGVSIFLIITLALVIILLIAKKYLVHSGKVKVTINNDKVLEADSGKTLLSTFADHNIFLSSACGGKGSCGQCKCQVFTGGGDILPTEKVHFSRKQQQDHWRLGCQVKIKEDCSVGIPASALDVKEWECEVISNKNVATFIKDNAHRTHRHTSVQTETPDGIPGCDARHSVELHIHSQTRRQGGDVGSLW